MKKILLSVSALLMTLAIYAQSNAVDALFNKYSEKDGFTVVSISGRMFSIFADNENSDPDNVIDKLKSIKILSVSDSLLNPSLNFYSELNKLADLSVYEELMVVKEGRDVTKFLIRQSGKMITELVVIAGGPGGNSLISIRGEFSLKNISDMSKDLGLQELNSLEGLDKKKP